MVLNFTIFGEPASKANSRQIVTIGGRPSSIKSKKARGYEHDALRQIPPAARQRLEGPVCVTLRIFYASERPDLDESIVLDVLQDRWGKAERNPFDGKPGPRPLVQAGVYRNDRQVREKHVFHGIDRKNPRTEVIVEPLAAQQPALIAEEPQPQRQPEAAAMDF
jgi:Holliday junction resolvase RusA-like endonuclease